MNLLYNLPFFIMDLLSFIVALHQARKKGVVLSNRYFVSGEEERKERDWTDYYNQSRNTFALLGLLCLSFTSLTSDWKYKYYLPAAMVIIICVYVIASSAKMIKKYGL